MGIELELAGLNEAGVISPDRFNRYMDYLEAGVDYGFDGDKAYKAYYQDTCALLYAANSNTPKVRYIYDATYQFIKGTYEKGYLQYLSEETITLNDVSDIGTALEAIAKKLEASIGTGRNPVFGRPKGQAGKSCGTISWRFGRILPSWWPALKG